LLVGRRVGWLLDGKSKLASKWNYYEQLPDQGAEPLTANQPIDDSQKQLGQPSKLEIQN
jgi:hypothetical protein